jgi:TraY domain
MLDTMAKKKPRGRGRKAYAAFRLDANLIEQLEALALRNRRTKTMELVIALEKHLEENGLWPPQQEGEPRKG